MLTTIIFIYLCQYYYHYFYQLQIWFKLLRHQYQITRILQNVTYENNIKILSFEDKYVQQKSINETAKNLLYAPNILKTIY